MSYCQSIASVFIFRRGIDSYGPSWLGADNNLDFPTTVGPQYFGPLASSVYTAYTFLVSV